LQRGHDDGARWTLATLHDALERPKAKLQVALRLLRHRGVVGQDRDGQLTLTRSGLDADALEKLLRSYRHKRESDRAMLERMVFYGQTGHCRWKVLLDNFGEAEGFASCGACDNCIRIAAAFAAAERERESEAADADRGADAEGAASPLPARGELVSVPRYGRGIVDAVDAEGVTVVFAEGVRRVFLPAFVRRRTAPRKRSGRAAKVTASAA
jgi:ATP-dependent DNA helicase RecQ